MPRSARRNKPPQQGAGGWSRLQAPSGRALLCCLLAALLLWVMMGVFLSGEDKAGHVDPVARDRDRVRGATGTPPSACQHLTVCVCRVSCNTHMTPVSEILIYYMLQYLFPLHMFREFLCSTLENNLLYVLNSR